MAPSRRKGVGKAAAAAAATTRREWKVGDLVLAKVKGFPAWPATVSEPEKWGYPADRKKVLVHFFGTQQIGFCNPADVEEFTEERKLSLLGKRHGKGADFARAVNEIIISFEKLKKREQVSSADETTEIIINNENKLEESLTKCVNDEDSAIRDEPQPLRTAATNDLNSLTEAAVAAAAEDASCDAEMQLEEAQLFAETPVSTTYSTRSKTEVTQSRNSVIQGRISARRLRSSSKIGPKGPQNIRLSSVNNSRRSRHSGITALKDRSLRRSARIMKSSDDSEGYDADSPSSVSTYSAEENESEVMTVNSDSPSFNNGSTVESHCKLMVGDHFSENNNDEETELNNRLDFQTSAAIVKKKRGPNRKRHCDDGGAANSNAFVPDAELRNGSVSPPNNEKSDERCAREDGDGHLPLFKRARVRLERSAPAEKKEGIMAHREEKILEVTEIFASRTSEPLNSKVDDPGNGESVQIEVDSVSMPLCPTSPEKAQSCEGGKNLRETRNIVDGEAALPPSKRLHRALEAMSANVAEDIQCASSYPLTVNTESNGDCPSIAKCSELSIVNKAVIELGLTPVENHINNDSKFDSSEFCAASNTEKPLIDSKTCAIVSNCVKSHSSDCPNPELFNDSTEDTKGADFKCFKVSPLKIDSKHVKLEPENIGEEKDCLDHSAPGFIVSLTNHSNFECSELDSTVKGSGPDRPHISSEVLALKENGGSILDCDTRVLVDNAVGEGDNSESVKGLYMAANTQDNEKSEFVKERNPVSKFSNCMLSGNSVKLLSSGHHQCLSNCISISDEPPEVFSVTQSSSLTNGLHLFAKTSPSSSMGNVSASDNNNIENRSSCSPDVQLNSEKAKLAGKSSSKGEETLLSFEATIRSLTGTKESIGRATRIAIDCAKFGFSIKVVEILAQNLERESNSHKKVDLFFLVDSIAQCSRGMKGDGGIYPSVIQAVLPRLLLAAAPPGSSSLENHRQCLKVLRVWQERKILPDPIIHHHIRELDALCVSYPKAGSRRPLRNERAFDDPIREMEGMLVDEYGSNSSFQLPGFCMPRMLREDDVGSDSDGESFEAVTPEHNGENVDGERILIPAVEKRSLILEDVDGELEMEDVAPYYEEISSTSNLTKDHTQLSHHHSDNHYGPPFISQQSKNVPSACARLPRSPSHPSPPPPPPYPLPPSSFSHAVLDSTVNGPNSNIYPSSQNFDNNLPGSVGKQPGLSRMKSANLDSVHHRARDNKDFEAQIPRQMLDNMNSCSFNDRPTSHLSAQGSNRIQPGEAGFNKGLHVRPPHPAPSNQFSYPQQRIQSRRDLPPPSHPNRFHMRNEENSNFYRDRDRNKFVPRDNIGECWRPPLPPISGQCYRSGARMCHGNMPYSGPPREASTNSRWNFPPRPPNHRQFHPYREPEGPIPVGNRGPNYWRPR